ncbi:hypothetical protein K2173_016546 [Erythroxylum novogranatense]|uniref:Reticulon-like protein n=1 Tax=Erythroxylum novogranatense TaxID=1862640 RepID=A0AAV8SGM0_9ROSI|nr:hypothetical protein K2173_016546 [Erythroxylum novogranatense]
MDEAVDGIEAELVKEIENDKDSSTFSSDSEIEAKHSSVTLGSNKNRLFGRQRPLHLVLGAGLVADIILWRNKHLSGCIFGGVSLIWILFECFDYHFLTFVSHSLIFILSTLFLWSHLSSFINVSPPELPEITVPEQLLVTILLVLRDHTNQALATLRGAVYGQDLKMFLLVILSLWVISVIGGWFSFLSLFYLVFVMVMTLPMLYEKHEDVADSYGEKAWIEIKKHYAVIDKQFLHKVPMLSSHHSKQH